MVTVYFELPDEEIISTSKYFNNSYTDAGANYDQRD